MVLGLRDKASYEQIKAVMAEDETGQPHSQKIKFWIDFMPKVIIPATPDYDDILDVVWIKYRGQSWDSYQFNVDLANKGKRGILPSI